MITLDCQQGSPEWLQARLGIPTASRFDRIITPKAGKPSTQAFGLMCECLAELMLGEPIDGGDSMWMERGRELEEEAIRWLEFEKDVTVRRVGLCLRDDRMVGCSPDGLIDDHGGIEVKCPGAKKHVGYMLKPDWLAADYRTQVQGGLWVTGRKWWTLMSYNPRIQPVVCDVARDEPFIEKLAACVDAFVADLKTFMAELGVEQAKAPELPAPVPAKPRNASQLVGRCWDMYASLDDHQRAQVRTQFNFREISAIFGWNEDSLTSLAFELDERLASTEPVTA